MSAVEDCDTSSEWSYCSEDSEVTHAEAEDCIMQLLDEEFPPTADELKNRPKKPIVKQSVVKPRTNDIPNTTVPHIPHITTTTTTTPTMTRGEGREQLRARITARLHGLVDHTWHLMTSSVAHLNTVKLLADHLDDVYQNVCEMQALVAEHDLEAPVDLTPLNRPATPTQEQLGGITWTPTDPITNVTWGVADLFDADLYDQAHDSYNVPDSDGC